MTSIALIGANGFVAQSIKKYLLRNKKISLISVTRENYEVKRKGKHFDIIINAAMPSKRYWAKRNPYNDFCETIEKTFNIVNNWNSKKIIHISSISARSQLNTTYGRHKAAAEKLVLSEKNLIIRLGPMYGKSLNKGVIIDMKNDQQVFVSKESLYCFAPVDWVGESIANNLQLTGLLELGGNNAIKLSEVAAKIGSKSIFTGPVDDQIISKHILNAPESSDVIDFILKSNNK